MNNLLQILIDKYRDIDILLRFTPHNSIAEPVIEDYFEYLNSHFQMNSYINVSFLDEHMHRKIDIDTVTFINNQFGSPCIGFFVTKKLFKHTNNMPYLVNKNNRPYSNRRKYMLNVSKYGQFTIT